MLLAFLSLLLIVTLSITVISEMKMFPSLQTKESMTDAYQTALAVDCALNDGLQASFDRTFSIEQNKLHISGGSKIIEVGGVFESDYSEPV